jgi:hypothetical protein
MSKNQFNPKAGDWDEESIVEGRESFLIYLGL